MENGKSDNREENPIDNIVNGDSNYNTSGNNDEARGGAGSRSRTPFTELSQVEADLALARTLQEQERAYMMIRMGAGDGSDYGSWETGSFGIGDEEDDDFDDHVEGEYEGSEVEEDENEEDEEEEEEEEVEEEEEDEEAFGVTAHYEDGSQNAEIDPSAYSSDEAYAQALQDAEEREMTARLLGMAGISGMVVGENEDDDDDEEGHGGDSQELMAGPAVGRNYRSASLSSLDLDNLSYEELMALGEVVGTESRGLSADTIASLPSIEYKSQSLAEGICESCVICRLDYDEGDTLTVLSCKHSYHPECINNWLQIKKVCPVCNVEVSNTANS